MLKSSKQKVWIIFLNWNSVRNVFISDIPAKFIKPIKLKKLQPNRVDDVDPPAIEVVQTEVEKEKLTNYDDDTDSITCTVEESEFICFEEESLDLTVSDEFTEECFRY